MGLLLRGLRVQSGGEAMNVGSAKDTEYKPLFTSAMGSMEVERQ